MKVVINNYYSNLRVAKQMPAFALAAGMALAAGGLATGPAATKPEAVYTLSCQIAKLILLNAAYFGADPKNAGLVDLRELGKRIETLPLCRKTNTLLKETLALRG